MKDENGGKEMKDLGRGAEDLRGRTKGYAIATLRLYAKLPKTTEAQVLGKQLLRSGTSVGAHYRESCRAKSDADFISKVEGGLQELDESLYWLELLKEIRVVAPEPLEHLMKETEELISIFVTIVKKVKTKR